VIVAAELSTAKEWLPQHLPPRPTTSIARPWVFELWTNPSVFPAKSTKSQFSYLQHSHIWITYLQDCREKAKPSKTSRSTTKVDSIKNLQRTQNQTYKKVFFSFWQHIETQFWTQPTHLAKFFFDEAPTPNKM
jgi:hypothetical protein